jgi:hypothetical protein
MLIGYARVSAVDQNLALQRDALTEAECVKIFTEQMPGVVADRPALPRFVTGEIKRRTGDVVGLDQAEQMKVGQPRQRGVSRNQFFDPLGHRRRRCNRVDANSLQGVSDSKRTGDCGDATLCRGVAIATGDPHQRDV